MKSRLMVVPGSEFDSGVLPAGPLEPAIAKPKGQLVDQFMEQLSDLLFHRELLMEAESRAIHALVGERLALNEKSSKLIEQVQTRAREKILTEHELAKKAVRQQQKLIEKHREQILALTSELNKANDARAAAFALRDQAQAEKRLLSRYAEKSQHEKANELLAQREREADLAAKESGTLQQQINFLTLTGLKPLQEKLNDLVADEARLAHHVTGASYTDELGIVHPPGLPI